MVTLTAMCCVSVTLASRMIAAMGLSVSILMINVLLSVFFGHDDQEFFDAVDTWTLLGLHWTEFFKNIKVPDPALIVLACFLGYLVLYVIASALLALGTVFRRPNYAVLWLYLQMISIADQLVALLLRLTSIPESRFAEKSHWYTPLSTFYLLISVYFWLVVFTAREEWTINPVYSPNMNVYPPMNDEVDEERPGECHQVKSPSFLAQNHLLFESPAPLIPVKYDVV